MQEDGKMPFRDLKFTTTQKNPTSKCDCESTLAGSNHCPIICHITYKDLLVLRDPWQDSGTAKLIIGHLISFSLRAAEGNPILLKWLTDHNTTYARPKEQNEILKNMANAIIQEIASKIKVKFYCPVFCNF